MGLSHFLPYVNRLLGLNELKLVRLEEILVSSLRNNKLDYVIICCFLLHAKMNIIIFIVDLNSLSLFLSASQPVMGLCLQPFSGL
jgi:hypothetical protein